jgi:hypothetical protein
MIAAYEEILDFVTSAPTLQQIVSFTHSTQTLERVAWLEEAARNETISAEELLELREFQKAAAFIDQLKIRASRRLQKSK